MPMAIANRTFQCHDSPSRSPQLPAGGSPGGSSCRGHPQETASGPPAGFHLRPGGPFLPLPPPSPAPLGRHWQRSLTPTEGGDPPRGRLQTDPVRPHQTHLATRGSQALWLLPAAGSVRGHGCPGDGGGWRAAPRCRRSSSSGRGAAPLHPTQGETPLLLGIRHAGLPPAAQPVWRRLGSCRGRFWFVARQRPIRHCDRQAAASPAEIVPPRLPQ